MVGFKTFYNARRVIIGIELAQKIHKRAAMARDIGRARSSSTSRPLLVFVPCETLLSLKMVAQYRFATPKPLKTCQAPWLSIPRFRLLNDLLSNRPLEYGVFYLSRKSGTVQRELFGLPPKTTNPQEVGP